MTSIAKPRPTFKVWLETDEGYVFGPGVYSLLKRVKETGTLKDAAESLGMSYRFAWGLVKKAESKIGEQLLQAHKGGKAGGGGVKLTEVGLQFLADFTKIEALLARFTRGELQVADLEKMNRVEGVVSEVKMDDDASVTLRLDQPSFLRLRLPRSLVIERGMAQGVRLDVEFTPIIVSIIKREEGGLP